MRTEHLSKKISLAGILIIALGGCGNSSSGGSQAGGTMGSGGAPEGSGGSGSGGIAGTGGDAVGGTMGSGGSVVAGGAKGTGGAPGTGGAGTGGSGIVGSGGRSTLATGGATGAGGVVGTGGGNAGGIVGATGGAGAGGRTGTGGNVIGGNSGSGTTASGGVSGKGGTSGTAGSTGTGTCTASKATGTGASGTGPHKVTVETNADPGISEGTIFRPTDLGGSEKYPIFAWGEGGCSENGNSNSAAMAELASHGYFIIADGTPGGSASRSQTSDTAGMGKPLLAYITWAIAENAKPCSAYYQSLDTTKIATNGFSCGGLMAEGTAGDPRITTWGLNSSGLFSADQAFYKTVHTPVLIVLGGSGDMAYTNGERDYTNISALGIPIMLFSKALGHGGDLFTSHGGDFTKIDLAWLNWWLKGDEGATGKGVLVGSTCTYCTDSAWEVKSKNLP
jgi:dienelactone hydrolase